MLGKTEEHGSDLCTLMKLAWERAQQERRAAQAAAEEEARRKKEQAKVEKEAEKEAARARAKEEAGAKKAAAAAAKAEAAERSRAAAEAAEAAAKDQEWRAMVEAAERAKTEKEAKAEAEAARAIEEANTALERARAKEESKAKAKTAEEARQRAQAEKQAEKERARAAREEEKLSVADLAARRKAEAEAAKAEAEAIAKREAAAAADDALQQPPIGSARGSTASSAAQARLARSQSRMFGGRRRSSASQQPGDADAGGESHRGGGGRTSSTGMWSAASTKSSAWSSIEKALREASLEDAMSHGGSSAAAPLVSARATVAAHRWLQPWREAGGAGGRERELRAICGFTADSVALDESADALVCIGGGDAGDGKSVSLYSAASGALRHAMAGAHSDLVCSVAVSGDVIASGSRDRTIRLWSIAAGCECVATLHGCQDLIHGLALEGDLLLSGEGGGKKTGGVARARLWSVQRAACTMVWAEHTASVFGVALGTGAGVAASASHDSTARVWALPKEEQTDEPEGGEEASPGGGASNKPVQAPSRAVLRHPASVQSVSIADRLVATGCGDGKARVWSLADTGSASGGAYACIRVLEHSSRWEVACVRLTAGGVLLSGGGDQAVRLWALDTEECVGTLSHGDVVKGVAAWPAAGLVATAGGRSGRLIVWRPSASE